MPRFHLVRNILIITLCLTVLSACGEPAPTLTPTPQSAQPTQPVEQPQTSPQGAPVTPLPVGTQQQPGTSLGVGIGSGSELIVFAASSLTDVFEDMKDELKTAQVDEVIYNFAGSQTLAAQIEQGAIVDVLAVPDEQIILDLIEKGFITRDIQKVMATNKLVVITPPGANPKVTNLNDLVKPGIKLVLADQAVPAGKYALQALDKLSADKAYGTDFKERTLANVVSREPNVRQVLAKVQLGEADAGIVYITDAQSTAASGEAPVGMIDIPDEYNVEVKYYIAPVIPTPHATYAIRFIKYVIASDGQRKLGSFGFGPIR